MKHEKPLKFPFQTFFAASSIIAVIIAVAASLVFLAAPEFLALRNAYAAFLVVASTGGGFLISCLVRRQNRRSSEELRINRERLAALDAEARGLTEAAERREEFIASFAHELKTPLTAIIGYADMLRSKELSPKNRFTAAGYIFSEGKRLEALSLKLMEIIVAGKHSFTKKRFDAGYFLREVAAVTLPSLANDGMTLSVHCERGEIEVEPDLFKTLLINLVDNARKASSKGDSVSLIGKNEEGGFALYVVDNGRGISADELSKITEAFYMIDKSRARDQNGAGLGLALCRRIAELHGTELQFKSEPGRGTSVRLLMKEGG